LAEKFTEMDIISNAILMYLAGAEPVSDTLGFCLHELAMNKHVQDKLRKHINTKRKEHGGEFTNDYLMDLHYADMVLTGNQFKCILENLYRLLKYCLLRYYII